MIITSRENIQCVLYQVEPRRVGHLVVGGQREEHSPVVRVPVVVASRGALIVGGDGDVGAENDIVDTRRAFTGGAGSHGREHDGLAVGIHRRILELEYHVVEIVEDVFLQAPILVLGGHFAQVAPDRAQQRIDLFVIGRFQVAVQGDALAVEVVVLDVHDVHAVLFPDNARMVHKDSVELLCKFVLHHLHLHVNHVGTHVGNACVAPVHQLLCALCLRGESSMQHHEAQNHLFQSLYIHIFHCQHAFH